MEDVQELSDDEVIAGAEQWCRLQQLSDRAWEMDGDASAEEVGEKMDGELWGDLHDYVSLHLVWEKQPVVELSRLRVVGKEWNRSALERLEVKPYFVIIASEFPEEKFPFEFEPVYLNGLLRYDVVSSEFSFKHHISLESGSDRVPPFAVEGLVFDNLGNW